MADKTGLFEVAAGGTVLLDEVGDLPAALQAKLLRVVQDGVLRRVGETKERRVDVRLLAATARDLETDVREGRFREDLFYRLNVIRLHLPPLRERPEDLPQLAAVLLARVAGRAGRPMRLAPDALGALRRHPWPGNVRELERMCSSGQRSSARTGPSMAPRSSLSRTSPTAGTALMGARWALGSRRWSWKHGEYTDMVLGGKRKEWGK